MSLKRPRILVTGATGFLGTAIVREFRDWDVELITLSRGRRNVSVPDSGCRHVNIDLHDYSKVRDLLAEHQPTACIHAAWDVTPGVYLNSPDHLRWLDSSLALAVMARHHGCRWFCGIGTCLEQISDEGTCTPYGYAKWQLEKGLAILAGDDPRMNVCWLRVFQPYGAGEAASRFIPALIETLRQGHPFVVEHPDAVRDFIHVTDIARAVAKSLESQASGAFDLGTGLGHRLETVGLMVADALDARPLLRLSKDSARRPMLVAEAEPLRVATGWRPSVSLHEGLLELVKNSRTSSAAA